MSRGGGTTRSTRDSTHVLNLLIHLLLLLCGVLVGLLLRLGDLGVLWHHLLVVVRHPLRVGQLLGHLSRVSGWGRADGGA